MRTFVESLRRLYINKKITKDYINKNDKLTAEEKAYILS